MASVYKLKCNKRKRNEPYWIDYYDHEGTRRRKKGFSEKSLSEQLAAKLETEAMLRRTGLIDPLAEDLAAKRRSPINEHVIAYEKNLKQRGTTGKHVKLTMGRIRAILLQCETSNLAELTVERVQTGITKLQEKAKFGSRTFNHYVQAVDGFCHWLVETTRIASHPLLTLKRLNAEVDVRHKRRALDDGELWQLIESARKSGKRIQGYDGEQRARVYLLSCLTGLRRSEVASLSPQSFNLQGKEPTVTVEAACSKHRRLDVLPLHPELVGEVAKWVKGRKRDELLFPGLERKKTWLMVKKDLERVGIPYETQAGIADFHAAGRHSYVTGLLRNGATLPEAKELARHSDVKMTMKYTHIGLKDQSRALASLPSPTVNGKSAENAGQHIGRSLCDGTGSAMSRPDSGKHSRRKKSLAGTQEVAEASDATGQKKSGGGDDCHSPPDEWRRRESNPRPEISPRKLLRA